MRYILLFSLFSLSAKAQLHCYTQSQVEQVAQKIINCDSTKTEQEQRNLECEYNLNFAKEKMRKNDKNIKSLNEIIATQDSVIDQQQFQVRGMEIRVKKSDNKLKIGGGIAGILLLIILL